MAIGPLLGAMGGSVALGVLVGLSGIGGFLLPPWLSITLSLPPAQAVPITLLGFAISSLVASAFYARNRAVDFRVAGTLATASLPGIGIGLLVGAHLSARTWSTLIGVTLVVAATWLLRPRDQNARAEPAVSIWWVCGTGLVAGAAAVLAGVTGPLVLLPGLRAAGVSSPTAVGTSLLASVGISLAGVIGYGALSGPPVRLATHIVPAVVIGTVTGAALSRRVSAATLNVLIRVLCALAGLWMLLR